MSDGPGGQAPDSAVCLAQIAASLSSVVERLDESNRLAEAHTDLLRQVGDAAVLREAEAIQRDTERLKLITNDAVRADVLDEVLAALTPVLNVGYFANAEAAIEMLRAGWDPRKIVGR